MNGKPTQEATGNESENPSGKRERKTRTVEVRVWTNHLGALEITPLLTAGARRAAYDAGRNYNKALERHVKEDHSGSVLYFAPDRPRGDVVLRVFDGGECILERDSLPTLDAAYLVGYAKALHEHGEVTPDNFDRYEDYCEGEPELYQSVARAAAPGDAGFNAGTMREFWERVRNGDIPEEDGFTVGLIKHFGNRLGADMQPPQGELQLQFDFFGQAQAGLPVQGRRSGRAPAFLDSVGEKGKCTVFFGLEIPENEPFSIDKLHFFNECAWWDSAAYGAVLDEMVDMDTSLELLAYDGRIHCRETDVEDFLGRGIPGWKHHSTVLVHADLKEFDPEQLMAEAGNE